MVKCIYCGCATTKTMTKREGANRWCCWECWEKHQKTLKQIMVTKIEH